MPLCNCRTARHRPVGTSSWSASRSCHGCHLLIFCSERESDVCTSPGDAQGAQYGASEQLDSAGLRGQAVCYEVRSTCVHHPSVSARSDVVDVLRRWGADRQPLPVQDGGQGVGHPGSISHRLGWEGLTVPKVGRAVLPGPEVAEAKKDAIEASKAVLI